MDAGIDRQIIKKKIKESVTSKGCRASLSSNEKPYLHGMYDGHLLGDLHRQLLVGQFPGEERPGVDVLLYPAAGEDAVQFGPQVAFGEEGEDDGFGDEGLEGALAVGLAVDADEHLPGLVLEATLLPEFVREGDVVEEVGQTAAERKRKRLVGLERYSP